MFVKKNKCTVHRYLNFINESYFIQFSMREFNDVIIIGNPADNLFSSNRIILFSRVFHYFLFNFFLTIRINTNQTDAINSFKSF